MMLKSIHSDDGNPSRANIKQALCTLEKGLTFVEGDGDMKKMYDMAKTYGLIDLYITHIPKNLAEYYYKKLTFNASDEEVTSKVKTHKKRKRDAGSMSAEELVAWLEVDVAGPVANNVVGVEVVPPSAGRRWRGGPYSPKFVPDFALSDEACKTLSGATTKGQRPQRTIKLPSHLQDYAMLCGEVETLKDKLDLVNQERSLLVKTWGSS
ncbi:hypothetical protein Tco_0115643 [Tanacetum coccineum]